MGINKARSTDRASLFDVGLKANIPLQKPPLSCKKKLARWRAGIRINNKWELFYV
jgi:hypothetical protein